MSTGFDPAAYLIARGLVPPDCAFEVSELRGGYWNQVLRLRSGAIDWVVKRFHDGPGPRRFPNLPAAEAAALEVLIGEAVAPAPVAFFADEPDGHAVLVYEFYEGENGVRDGAPLADAMARMHAPEVLDRAEARQIFRRLDLEPAAVLAEGDALLAALPDAGPCQRLRARRPSPQEVPAPERLALVHTDVGPGNVISGAEGPRIIDWQCPGIGDPAEDLYSFLSPAFQMLGRRSPLNNRQREAFLRRYGDLAVIERFERLEHFYSYRMLAYCCARIEDMAGTDPTVRRIYATAFDAEIEALL